MSFSLLTKLQVCGNIIANTAQKIDDSNCLTACLRPDEQNQACGETDAILLYFTN